MSLQNLTIRSPKPDDKSDFDRIHAGKHDLTASQAFHLVMNAYRSQGQNVSEKNTDGLQAELEKLKEEKASLLHENADLNGKINALIAQVTDLEARTPETIEVPEKIKEPAFVFDPSQYEGLKSKMQRAIVYEIKEDNLKKSDKDLPAQFTARALKYYLKNEFNHIMK